ncbi:WbqC family protein [Litoribacter ruber]|uniref:WbqC family protein n=1 Tax=Litoribacter ruber TaxID=702568 RepID=UPI001BDA1A32|nr:WbqC family protein [Litoribacter ruber]MBT0811559.1 WbqC family protein [Litoribacter ruber]
MKIDKGSTVITDLLYLPPIEYFAAIEGKETLMIEGHDNYQKQTYRNRASIRLANKVEHLSVPVKGGKGRPFREIEIDYEQKWVNIHLRGIKSAYGKAAFFEYFFPYYESVFERRPTRLFDLNLELLTLCLKFLQHPVRIVVSTEYQPNVGFQDLRGVIQPKESYEVRGIYRPVPYMQLFGLDFVPNLSVIDLLFCEGPQAGRIISQSKKTIEQSPE